MPLLNILIVTLPAGSWTAIPIPAREMRTCSIANKSGQTLRMRSDPADPNTEDSLTANSEQELSGFHSDSIWESGVTGNILWMSPTGADATVIVRWL